MTSCVAWMRMTTQGALRGVQEDCDSLDAFQEVHLQMEKAWNGAW